MRVDQPLLTLLPVNPGACLRVLVVHHNALVRRGLRAIIADHPDLAVVAEAADGHEAAHVVRALGSDGLDVAVVDVGAHRAWRSAAGELGVATVVFSMSALRGGRFRGLRVGAAGALGKHLAPSALAQVLRQAHSGGRLCPALAEPRAALRGGD